MLGSNMSALQGFAGSDATSTALSFATGSVVRQPSLHVTAQPWDNCGVPADVL